MKSAFRVAHVKYSAMRKFIPIIGVLLLLAIYWSSINISTAVADTPIKERLTQIWFDFWGMFIFNDGLYVFTTVVLLITLWTGYRYWLLRLRPVYRNQVLLEKLVIASLTLIFVLRHVKATSAIATVVDWVIFLILLYLIIAGTWFLAKTIDAIDLHSDLYCWGLRILGAACFGFGFLLLFSSSLALVFSDSTVVLDNVWWILSICIILLGAFMEYRSFRRHPAIMLW